MASTSSSSSGVPPGFRFHPTDEELLQYYLRKKVAFENFDLEVIREVDLNKVEPWELQERCRIGSAPQNEWYFFSHKDRKYPTGSRTNRATAAGFWKATGRDKCIRSTYRKIGMRKTLVFYCGRAPHGQKTDWIMHEYRLEDNDDDPHAAAAAAAEDDGWVVCRVFKKKAFFKPAGEEGSSSRSAAEDHHHHHTSAADAAHGGQYHPPTLRDPLYMHHRDGAAAFEHHPAFPAICMPVDLALHYPPATQQYPHLPPVQNLLTDHRPPPSSYDFPVLPGESPPPVVPRPYGMGLAGPCEPLQGGHDCAGRAQNSNEWMMLDRVMDNRLDQEAGPAAAAAAAVDGSCYRSPAPENQVGQLPHHRPGPGEMDLWGYGK